MVITIIAKMIEIYISEALIARILPNKYPNKSTLNPLAIDSMNIPIPNPAWLTIPIAESPYIAAFSLIFNIQLSIKIF